jgi:hypothetical protein
VIALGARCLCVVYVFPGGCSSKYVVNLSKQNR